MANKFTKAEKEKWMAKFYFEVSNNPKDDVNPFLNMESFLDGKVSDLDWGKAASVKKRSKIRFSETLRRVLQIFDIRLSRNTIETSLKQTAKNKDVVVAWAKAADFPPKP